MAQRQKISQMTPKRANLAATDLLEISEDTGSGYVTKSITGQQIIASGSYGLFAQTANSVPIAATTVEGTLIDGGVGSLTVPANFFKVGDSFMATMGGHISSANNVDIRLRVKAGSVVFGDTGLFRLGHSNAQHWDLQIRFTVRAIGAAGVASIASFGQFTYSKDASTTFEGADFSTINNTTFDTTISNTFNITIQWANNNAANSIYSENFILTKIY